MKKIAIATCLVILLSFTEKTNDKRINSSNAIFFSIGIKDGRPMQGEFYTVESDIKLNKADLASSFIYAEIKTSSLATDNENHAWHLKSHKFFDTKNYPSITFRSSQIKRTPSYYLAKGTITIKNISKDIEIPFIYFETRQELVTKFMLNRLDFKLGENPSFIDNEIEMELHLAVNNSPKQLPIK